jgi:hypothetical protein
VAELGFAVRLNLLPVHNRLGLRGGLSADGSLGLYQFSSLCPSLTSRGSKEGAIGNRLILREAVSGIHEGQEENDEMGFHVGNNDDGISS